MGRSTPAAGLRSTEIGSSLRAERKEELQAQPEPIASAARADGAYLPLVIYLPHPDEPDEIGF
jgi:hypothetical protein